MVFPMLSDIAARALNGMALPDKRVALLGEESVSVGHRRHRHRVNQEHRPMRIYIIGNDGITLCREPPTALRESEIAVASNAELHAAPLSGKQLLALWNALPGVAKRRRVGDRDALIDQLKGCRIRSRAPTRSAPQSRTWLLPCCGSPRVQRWTRWRA